MRAALQVQQSASYTIRGQAVSSIPCAAEQIMFKNFLLSTMSLFSMEAQQLRLKAQQSSTSEPYPLDLPAPVTSTGNRGSGSSTLQGELDNSRHDHQEPSDLRGQGDLDNSQHDHQEPSDLQDQRPAANSQHDRQEPADLQGDLDNRQRDHQEPSVLQCPEPVMSSRHDQHESPDLQGGPQPKFPPSPPSHFCESPSEFQEWGQERSEGRSAFDFLRDGPSVDGVVPEWSRDGFPSPSFSPVSEARWYQEVREHSAKFPTHESFSELGGQAGSWDLQSFGAPDAGPSSNDSSAMLGGAIDGVIEKAVANEVSRAAPQGPALPWERGIFRSIFGSQESSNPFDNLLPRVPGPLKPPHVSTVSAGEPRPPVPVHDIASQAFGAFKDLHPAHEREQMMDKAVCKMHHVVGRIDSSRLSPELGSSFGGEKSRNMSLETIGACIGLRSPHTVLKRANTILSFLRWADKEELETPVAEEAVWSYFSMLKKEGSPPSRASAILSAFRFVNYVLGVGLKDILCSRRVCGLSVQLGIRKAPTSRARPLTVQEVRSLRSTLGDAKESDWNKAIAGYLLLALYSRARHSDLTQVEEVISDYDLEGSGYLEVRLRVHKTSQTLAKRNDLLPIIVSAKGVNQGDWLGAVAAAFSKVGLPFDGVVRAGIFRPCKPGGLEPGVRSLRSSECSSMLKLMLQRGGSDVSLVRSHSLKRTLLDWGSKFCIDEAVLALLGRHSKCVKGSVPVYAREEALKAVRAIEPMLQAVADGTFRPDATRAGYFAKASPTVPAASTTVGRDAIEAKVEIIEDSDEEASNTGDASSSATSSSASAADSDSSESDEPLSKMPRVLIEAWDQEGCVVNTKTHALHLLKHVSGGGTMIAVCGRASSNLVKARSEHMRYSRCRVCLKIGPPKDD